MATESPKQRSDEATLTSPAELTININTDSQDVDLNQPQVNSDIPASAVDEFENKHISDIVDDLVNSTEVSISGGSDNEATRSDASKGKGDGKGHGRVSSSTKKPTSFKSINVNKTFLTSKAPTPGAPPRVAEKTAATTTTMASAAPGAATSSRPRLVAKTGSGLVSKGSGAQGGKPAPDASAVWNKNRPVPPPEPKKYTDEELKKYGIHMATRLQSDATKGQSNWADIDDDDEDWDPDTITWKDGTKVAIALPEEPPAPTPPPPEPLVAQPVPKTKGPGPTTAAASNSPSIKPGVLGSGKGLVLKGAVEKPTLVAKPPPPPTPAKSPWATLPKIDKVSPIVAEASPHGPGGPPRSGPPRDGPMYPPHGQPPTKEIAADDFSRAPWRDSGASGVNANRELFNSQSGRYEPVHDRRGPMRQEQQYGRQPALMQRLLHEQQQGHGHMEYAGGSGGGGYQAGRNNEQQNQQQQGPYGRRRGSSNVSGGSGGWQRPLHPSEFPNARRPSMAGASDVPGSPSSFAPSVLQGGPQPQQGWPPGVSPGPTHATPYQGGPGSADGRGMPPPAQSQPIQPSPSAAPAVPVTEDDYELQKRLMRERRELAMRRRQEEEAKEEAARKERIRLKLEALGPAPESNKAKKAAAKDQPPVPAEIQSRVSATSEKAGLEPAESADGESEVPRVVIPQPAAKQLVHSPNGPAAQQQQQPQQGDSSPDSGVEPRLPSQGGASNAGPAHVWGSAPRQTERAPAVWGPQPSSTKNVWAAPSTNRGLGNGTFAADLGTPPSIPAGPGPIAPPSRARAGAPQSQQPPIGPPRQPQVVRGTATSDREREREVSSNDYAAAVQADDEKFIQALNSHQGEWERRLQADGRSTAAATDSQPTIKETWRPTKLDETGARMGGAPKQTVHVGQEKTPSPVPTASASVSAPGSAPVSEYGQLGQGSSVAPVAPMIGARTASTQGRGGSRFFPARDARQETRDIRLEPSQSDALPRHISPSPPPPDTDGHPAFDGDASHPHVSLPRPYPVVRLPPSANTSERGSAPGTHARGIEEPSKAPTGPANRQGPSFAWASQPAYKDAEKNAPRSPTSNVNNTKPDNNGWQARIDNLLGGRKVHASSARSATTDIRLEKQLPTTQQPTQQQQQAQPQQQQKQRQNEPARTERTAAEVEADKSVTTKGMAEECFEEQEMGSLPPIRFPKTVPEMAWQPSPAPKPLSKKLWPVVVSADPLTFPADVSGAGNVWRVFLPGGEGKTITVPFGRTRSNPRRGGPRGGGGGRHSSSGQPGRGKGRDGASSYAAEQRSNNTSTNNSNNHSSSHGRGHRGGGYRGRDNWSRNGPAQVQT
ncbi:uncharacterized protein C8A04DRAFT_14578 [Dichotomopilus funicola]|uniref:Uncharacterized protein n=1 Tax=Dichotomopilus funicola TaxID=1934379 RepID=A0AAN6ZIU5_9PEZI|nr:hypothetical protein C8A04DRAFT_14578 [Dichotomopilus funicola]